MSLTPVLEFLPHSVFFFIVRRHLSFAVVPLALELKFVSSLLKFNDATGCLIIVSDVNSEGRSKGGNEKKKLNLLQTIICVTL